MRSSPVVRALGLVWTTCPGWTVLSLGLLAALGLTPLLTLYLTKLVVDGVVAGVSAPQEARAEAAGHVAWLVALTAGAGLLAAAGRAASSVLSDYQAQLIGDEIYRRLQGKSVAADLEYYENPKYHDTLHRAQQEGAYRPIRVIQGLAGSIQAALSLASILALLAGFHWSLALVLFVSAAPDIWVRIRHSDTLFRWQRRRTPMERQVQYYGDTLTDPDAAKEIRLLGLGPLFMGRFADLRRQLRGERMALSVRRSAAELATQAAGLALLYGTYGWLAWRAVAGEITLGDLVMFEAAFSRGQGFLRDLLAGVGGLYENNLFLSNLFEFLDLTPRVADPPDPLPVPRPMREGFAFEGVSFRYPGEGESAAAGDGAAAKPREALHGIDFRVGPGEVVALVGENGSGKTTLIKLLCRLYEPTDGRITLDGTDVRRFGSAELRRQIAVIFQDFVRYHVTARDNIRFGNLDLGEADPQGLIPAAARASAADAVIGRLPAGYETMLGRRFENGAELSLGEWQKVALARAFVRDAQVIVMDEPTAAMDAKAEAEVFDNFRRLAAGRAAVLISHRLSTVKSADRIYVLDRGTVAEVGTHDELMSRRGLYARMFELQARNYR